MATTLQKRIAAGVLAVLGLAGAAPVFAATKTTGQSCVQEWYFNGQGISILGSRCAKGEITYTLNSGVYTLSTYRMRYCVSAGMTYGPHNDENPFQITGGYKSGNGGATSWQSPDSGDTDDDGVCDEYLVNRDNPNFQTWQGQTKVRIKAYPDIPSAPDPLLQVETATW